jgi:CRISPR system Cascade subunit CasD
MKTLLLRLEGPMQSWGTSSRFTERDTGLEPSKSGVIGLLCAALGKPRLEREEDASRWPPLSELVALRMGVRLDRPGTVGVDFQTAGGGRFGRREYGVAKADGSRGEAVMSWRYYLQDASFLVGLESENEGLLTRLHEALRAPVWPLSLGRKSYVPSAPVYMKDGMREGELMEVLASYPLAADRVYPVRIVLDDREGVGGEVRLDLPLDFSRRQFGARPVRVELLTAPAEEGF